MTHSSTVQDCLPLRGRWLGYFLNGLAVGLWLLVAVELVRPHHIIEHSKGPVGVAKTQVGNFKTAIELYRLDHEGRCPTTLEGLQALIVEPAGPQHGRWQGPYLNDVNWVPADPWGSPYCYDSPGPNGEPYQIVCLGADKLRGGKGGAADLVYSARK